jgi:hypothetical protein
LMFMVNGPVRPLPQTLPWFCSNERARYLLFRHDNPMAVNQAKVRQVNRAPVQLWRFKVRNGSGRGAHEQAPP